MKKFSWLAVLYSVAFSVFGLIFAGCEVGLGSAVDTQPPLVAVTAPNADDVIRDIFTMSGTCSDEQGLRSVTVMLKNTSTGTSYGAFDGVVNEETNTWTSEVDPFTANVPDGSYEATVTATDKSGRTTIATKSFVIDNTPPFLVLSRPSTKTLLSTDSYGKEFSIEGQVADDNNVEKLVVTVYDQDGIKIRDIELNNVPPTIDLTVAKYGSEDYEALYGSDSDAGTKYYYCGITIYDSARTCSENGVDADSKGNSTTSYYLYKDYYSSESVLSKYTPTEVYHILNGSYSNTSNSRALASKDFSDVLEALKEQKVEQGTFSLNPANNPTYVLTGYGTCDFTSINCSDENTETELKKKYGLLSSSSISVRLSAGLDQKPITESSLDIFLKPLIKQESGYYAVDTNSENYIWLLKEGKPVLKVEGEVVGGLTEVGSTAYNFTVPITAGASNLKTATFYVLEVNGKDSNNIEFVNYDNCGFYLESSGAAPTLTIVNPTSTTVYLPKAGSFTANGTVSAEENVSVYVTVTDNATNTKVSDTITAYASDGAVNAAEWSVTVPESYFNQTKSKDYTISVKASAGSRDVGKEFTVAYDVDGPVIDIASVLPQVTTYDKNGNVERENNVNGSITAKVRISDDYYKVSTTKKTTIGFYDGQTLLSTLFETLDTNITEVFDTTTFGNENDNKTVTMKVTAYDYAGNKSEYTKEFYINQATDKPIITLTNAVLKDDESLDYTTEYPSSGTKNMFVAGAPITATISDDDGIASITATILDSNNNDVGYSKTITSISSNPYPLTLTVPTELGVYSVQIVATDSEKGTKNDLCKFYFMVDTGDPVIILNSSDTYYGKAGGTIDISGTVKGLGGLKVYNDYDNKTEIDSNGDGTPDQPNEDVQEASWSDKFVVTSGKTENTSGYKITYTVADKKNRTAKSYITYFVDNTKPKVTISDVDSLISSETYKFQGTASDTEGTANCNSGVSVVAYTIKAGAYTSAVKAPSSFSLDNETETSTDGSVWKKLSGLTSWSLYQTFIEKGQPEQPDAFEEGQYTIYVCAYDVAQNVSSVQYKTFTVDLNPPTAKTSLSINEDEIDITAVSSKGFTKVPSSYNFAISDTLALAANPYALVITKDGTTLTANTDYTVTYSNGNGKVTFVNTMQDGTYTFTLTAKDAQNKETTVTNEVILDTTAPKIEFTSPESGAWQNTSNVTVSGSATDDNTILGVYYKKTNTAPSVPTVESPTDSSWTSLGWSKANGTGSWKFTVSNATQGETNYYVAAVDKYGNYSDVKPFVLAVDSVAPVIGASKFAQGGSETAIAAGTATWKKTEPTNDSFTLSGIITEPVRVSKVSLKALLSGQSESITLFDVTVPETNKNSYAWEQKILVGSANASEAGYLEDGVWTLTLSAIDGSDNESTKLFTITIDTVSPTVEFTDTDGVVSVASKKFTGFAFDEEGNVNSGISAVYYKLLASTEAAPSFDSATWTKATGTSNWSVTQGFIAKGSAAQAGKLEEGSYKLYVCAIDKALNTSSVASYAFTADLNPPVVKTYTVVNSDVIEQTETSGQIIFNSTQSDFVYKFSVTDTLALSSTPYTLTVKKGDTELTENTDYTVSADSQENTYILTIANRTDGNYEITVTGHDNANNETSVTNKILLDTVAPVISSATFNYNNKTAGANGYYSYSRPTLTVSAADVTSTISTVGYYTSSEKLYNDDDAEHKQISKNASDYIALTASSGSYTKALSLANGDTYVYLRAEDSAGNESFYGAGGTLIAKVDTTGPEVTFVSPDVSGMISKLFDLNFELSVVDEYSVVEGQEVTIKLGSTEITNSGSKYKVSGGKVTGTIDQSTMESVVGNSSNLDLSVVVQDELGNSTPSKVTLSFDNLAPSVSITNPALTSVNGKIQISGIAKDNVALSKVVLYRSYVASLDSAITQGTEVGNWTNLNADGVTAKVVILQEFESTDAYSWSYSNGSGNTDAEKAKLDISSFDGNDIVFYALAIDTASNKTVAQKTITVDQNTDRPVIKFSTVPLTTTMSSTNRIWVTKQDLYASVTDDDGVESVAIYVGSSAPEANSSDWVDCYSEDTGISYSFANDGSQDGPQNIYFKVVDTEGSVFISSDKSTGFDLKAPKIAYKDVEFGNTAGRYNTVIYAKIDLVDPEIPMAYYSIADYSSVTTEAALKALITNSDPAQYSTIATAHSANWNPLPPISSNFGGTNNVIYVLTKATDANGINNIALEFGGTTSNVTKMATSEGDTYKLALYKIDISNITTTAAQRLGIKAVDNTTSRSSSVTYDITVDNIYPTVTVSSSTSVVYGTNTNTITGTCSDDAVALYMAVTKNSEAAPTESDYILASETMSALVWNINFNGTESSTETVFYRNLLNSYVDSLYGTGTTESETQVPLCIWLYAVDALGNTGINKPTSIPLTVLTQGDKPTVSVTYPAQDATVGGTITLTGSTSIFTSSVSKVYIQIDSNYDIVNKNFNENWATTLDDLVDFEKVDYSIADVSAYPAIGKAIVAKGTVQSWYLAINQATEFNTNDDTNRNMAIRVYAVSETGKISEPEIVTFTLDPGSPVFGNTNALTMVQYSDNANGTGSIVASELYESGMWLRGKWWLTGSIEDDSGIEYLTLDGTNVTATNCTAIGSTGNYTFNIPVGIETAGAFGSKSYTLNAKENNGSKNTTLEVNINYDNKAPDFTSSTLSTSAVNTVIQSDGVYEIKGTFKETGSALSNQSGFNRIVFYATRESNSVSYLTDIMVEQGDSIADNSYVIGTDVAYDSNDGLYWKTATGCSTQNTTVTLPGSVPTGVRKGGLLKLNNVIYLIKDVSGSIITINKKLDTATNVTVYFAMAQVIDNTVSEVGKTLYYGAINDITNDDGDEMVESYSETSSEWKVSINSLNIKDGSIVLHFVAFDQAGNKTLVDYDCKVSNNAPRFAGVRYATDSNGDGDFGTSEYRTIYSGLYNIDSANKKEGISINGQAANGTKITKLAVPNNGSDVTKLDGNSVMTIKGKTQIVPEIVGGNDGLGWSYAVDSGSYSGVTKFTEASHSGNTDIRDTSTTTINLGIKELLEATNSTDGVKDFSFKIWDYTEGTTAGQDSNCAELLIRMNVALGDTTAPTASIKPFYWEGTSKNSVYYESGVAKGHIELEGDLPTATFTTGGSGEYDRDPKVSGIIYIEGTATDNVIVKELYMKVPGLDGFTDFALIAERNYNGQWTSVTNTADLTTKGLKFVSAEDSEGENEENIVTWKVALNTQRISGVAVLNEEIQVQAKDRGAATLDGSTADGWEYKNPKTSATSTTQTTTSDNTPYYKMDVVPYITKISTPNRTKSGLKDNNIRSASGKYSIMYAASTAASTYAADFITVSGFNLNPSAVRIVDSTTAKGTGVATTSGIAVTYSGTASDYTGFSASNVISKSGYLEVFTNGIRSLNNINNNDSYGTATNSANAQLTADNATVTDYAASYNREPDYYTTKNVQLTDDRYILLFDMHTALTPSGTSAWKDLKNAYYPVMLMNGDNPVFGYMNGSGGPSVAPGTGRGTGAGTYQASHAMPQRAEFNGTSGAEVYTEYLIKASAWDAMGMAVDEGGRYYNVSCYNRDGAAMSLIYDRYAELYTNQGLGWGAGTGYTNYPSGGNWSYNTGNNAITLDSMNYSTGVLLGRYMYPKLIAKGNSVTGNAKVYMAYYDDGTGEIAFRNFQLGTSVSGTETALGTTGTDKNGTTYAQKINFAENTSYGYAAGDGRLSAVASGSKYYDMVVTSDNHVVLVYYDESASQLKMVYSTNTVDGSSPTSTVAWTTSSVNFPSYVGTYVSMTIDSSNGIHIAAFDASDADLRYMYLEKYNSGSLSADVTVDSTGSVGHWTGIAICTNSTNTAMNGKPVISYYNSTETGTRESIKLAYPNAAIGSIKAGVDSSGYTAGGWEYMTIPAITPPQGGDSKFQKVCLGFDTKGLPVVGYCGTNLEFGKQLSE